MPSSSTIISQRPLHFSSSTSANESRRPCTNCLKKSRVDLCKYAPKPVKNRQPKSMAARLKRLEGMVREMLDEDGNVPNPSSSERTAVGEDDIDSGGDIDAGKFASSASGGQVIRGAGARGGNTTYVGATHFMAMLGDIEDLKSYFDHEENQEMVRDSPEYFNEGDSPVMSIGDRSSPRTRQEFLDLLPPKHVADRLFMRYFAAHSASQHVVHKPTFGRLYNEFWADPTSPTVEMDFFALLYMVFALAIFFSNFMAPHELASDNIPLTPMQRFRQYRAAAGSALTYSSRDGQNGFSPPGPLTCAPLILYVEADFLINRTSQMNCYLLLGVCIRIMLKMGLHRDPTKLPGSPLSPFEAEMGRRMWNLAIQIDLMVAFYLGLPSMIHGIESDTLPPRNLPDEDFDENTKELPPGRPDTEYTHMTYPTFKAGICKLFGLVARQAHALTEPTYDEVMDLDSQLAAKFDAMPTFMKVIQRFGIAALYHKAICVLHRRYLVEKAPRREHDYSRRSCLLAALALLEYQNTVFEATKPGGMLSQNGWFVSSLAMHDLLLAAMVVYLVIQNGHYAEPGGDFDWTRKDTVLPNKRQLMDALKRSYHIWTEVAVAAPEVRKAPEVLAVMFRKIERSRAAKGESVSMLGEIPRPEASGPTCYYPSLDSLRIDAAWVPEATDAMETIDWTSLERAIRANATFGPSSDTEQWMGDDSSFDYSSINFVDSDFMTGNYQGS
ncbi:putative c6 transcription factor [Diaporthe ampelina]|uniref:Putative c6 transcription factor n=1 Tax=Diaporthe ampelina TaxID=1214573 RepID=A0A0G2IBD0_9PEZI|nr:putative c6 transcription factor [Diaporthe ampelina]